MYIYKSIIPQFAPVVKGTYAVFDNLSVRLDDQSKNGFKAESVSLVLPTGIKFASAETRFVCNVREI